MEIKFINKTVIITPLVPIIDKRESLRLEQEITKLCNVKLGLNLRFVNHCTVDFFELMYKYSQNIGIYNIQSEIFTLFNIMNCDKYINLYTTEEDFLNNRFRLLNRQFKIA